MYVFVKAERTTFDKERKVLTKSIAYIEYDEAKYLFLDSINKMCGKFDKDEWKNNGIIVPGTSFYSEGNMNHYDVQYKILYTYVYYYDDLLYNRIEDLKKTS